MTPTREEASRMSLESLLLIAAGTALGTTAAALLIPSWVPSLSATLAGPKPKAFWYLSRSSGIVAFLLLWVSMLAGLGMSTRLARAWPGARRAFDYHQHLSLVGLALSAVHALLLLGDRFVSFSLLDVALPFAPRSLAVGLGQLALYAFAVIAASFWLKKDIGQRAWKLIHRASFVVFALVLTHGLAAGSDSSNPFVLGMYLAAAASVTFLTVLRIATIPSRQRAL